MGTHNSIAPILRSLSDQQRNFVLHYIQCGDENVAKDSAGYAKSVQGLQVLRQPNVSAAVRYEVARQLATEGAQIGYGCLKRIAKDTKAPAAAQVAAAKALLQGAGLLDAPQQDKESKSINDMTREELHAFIESKHQDIDKLEAVLADRARDITPNGASQPLDILD